MVRAPAQDEALRQLPEAIHDYHAWLRLHGGPAPPAQELVEIEIVGTSTGFGPFDPGDAAALLPSDREPIFPEEMERCFRLMAYARADLLDWVCDLSDDVLDWQPDPQSFSIRHLLRHIGNAEEWYVSRIVTPETLPPEWEHDEDIPILDFLEMERSTAVARLRLLTEEERSSVFYPHAGPSIPKNHGQPARRCAAFWNMRENTPHKYARCWHSCPESGARSEPTHPYAIAAGGPA